MKFKYIDPEGYEIESEDLSLIKKEFSRNYKEWINGSGDSSLEVAGKTLIIFKLEKGIFIMQLSDYSAPLIHKNLQSNTISYYVGGEPMNIPDVCLGNEEIAYKIVSYFIKNKGKLLPDYKWIDIHDYVDDI